MKPLISKRKEGDATCPSKTNTERQSNAAPTSNPSGAAPLPGPLEQEQWTVGCLDNDGRGIIYVKNEIESFITNEALPSKELVKITSAHNTSLRALQEELVAAKLRIKDLEEKEA